MTRDEAIIELAKTLHWKSEHLDPTEDPEWDDMTDRQREFWRLCVRALLDEERLLRVALDAR